MEPRLKLGVVGCGGYCRWHLSEFSKLPECRIVALCEPNPNNLQLALEAVPGLAGADRFETHGAMFAGADIDAVLISTPHTLHTPQALEAFAAGLHVLVDKPLATSVSDTRKVIEARDKAGKVGAIAYQRHGHPWFAWLRDAVSSGRYGKLLMLNSHLAQQWLQLTKGSWRQDPVLSGGGQLNDSGSHMVDVLLWATGLRASLVSAFIDQRGSEVDIDSVVTIQFSNGVLGSLTIIGDANMWHERHQVWFEHASVMLADSTVTIHHDDGSKEILDSWPEPVSPEADFVNAVLTGSDVLAPFECGLATIELTEAAWRSAADGGLPTKV